MRASLLLPCLTGCHALFQLTEIGSDASVPTDIAPGAVPAVVAHYRFEQTGPQILDETGAHHGTVMGGGMLVGIGGPVDNAIGFPADPHAYVVVPASDAFELESGSIELYVRPAPGQQEFGIFTRDSAGTNSVHISLIQSGANGFALRVQSSSELPGSLFLCSEDMTTGDWTHIGINFGPPEVELWIDGKRQLTNRKIVVFDRTETCGGVSARGLAGSPGDALVIGANSAGSTLGTIDTVEHHFVGGAIDELKILRVRQDFEDRR